MIRWDLMPEPPASRDAAAVTVLAVLALAGACVVIAAIGLGCFWISGVLA